MDVGVRMDRAGGGLRVDWRQGVRREGVLSNRTSPATLPRNMTTNKVALKRRTNEALSALTAIQHQGVLDRAAVRVAVLLRVVRAAQGGAEYRRERFQAIGEQLSRALAPHLRPIVLRLLRKAALEVCS